jgi:TetR/AcrR family transcriptional repressor of nem operon
MPRPRTFDRDTVLQAAQDAFWEKGFAATGVSDLEARTGINRSSLYLAFGSKRELLSEALDRYTGAVIESIVRPLEVTPGLEEIRLLFARIKGVIVTEGLQERRGCLLVNTIAELAPRDARAAARGAGLRDRLERAFARALASDLPSLDDASLRRRARFLMTSTIGIWICARIDLDDAATLCNEIAGEVADWGGATPIAR